MESRIANDIKGDILMKIGIVVRNLWSAGAPKIAINEAKELQKFGHNVTLIFLRQGKSSNVYRSLLSGFDFRIINKSGKYSSIFTPIFAFMSKFFSEPGSMESKDFQKEARVDLDLLMKFPKLITNDNFDLLICHDEYAAIAGYKSLKKLGIKYEVLLHEHLIEELPTWIGKYIRYYRNKVLTNAYRLFSVTDKISKDCEKKFGYKVIANPPGFEEGNIVEPQIRKRRIIIIGFVGRILNRDDPRSILHILDLEKLLPDYEFVHIGGVKSDFYLQEYKEMLKKNNSSMNFFENLDELEKIDLLSHSKFLIRFGKDEYGPGMPVVEALSFGVPVIVNSGLGSSEMIMRFKAGYVIDTVNADNIAPLIKNTTENDYVSLVNNAINLRNSWKWTDHAKELINNLDGLNKSKLLEYHHIENGDIHNVHK